MLQDSSAMGYRVKIRLSIRTAWLFDFFWWYF